MYQNIIFHRRLLEMHERTKDAEISGAVIGVKRLRLITIW